MVAGFWLFVLIIMTCEIALEVCVGAGDEVVLPGRGVASSDTKDSSRCNIPMQPISNILNDFKLPDHPVIYLEDWSADEEACRSGATRSCASSMLLRNAELRRAVSRDVLLHDHGLEKVTLSSSNAYSHGKYITTLSDYIRTSVDLDASTQQANETLYLFGNNYDGVWKDLADMYEVPPCRHCATAGAKTIGLGGHSSGVSFHYHGPGFAEVLQGRKRWFLFPAELTPMITNKFNPNMTVAQWVQQVYPHIYFSHTDVSPTDDDTIPYADSGDAEAAVDQYVGSGISGGTGDATSCRGVSSCIGTASALHSVENVLSTGNTGKDSTPLSSIPVMSGAGDILLSVDEQQHWRASDWKLTGADISLLRKGLFECTIGPGQVLYFPAMWMHATLNQAAYNVFFSLFLDTQLMKD